MTPYDREPLSGVHLSARAGRFLFVDCGRGAARDRRDLRCDAAIELEVVGRGRNRAPFFARLKSEGIGGCHEEKTTGAIFPRGRKLVQRIA